MNRVTLNDELSNELGYDLFRVKSDVNGNPRYVIHFQAFANTYDEAHAIAKSIGFQKYRGKDFGGGFVGQSYSVQGTAQDIIRVRNKYEKSVSTQIKQYLIDSITLDGYTDPDGNPYNEQSMTDGEKIVAAKRNFESEMGWLIERSGQHKACVDWLSGLCSTMNIAFSYTDIIDLARRTGGLKEGDSEKREDYICENYFPFMATKLLQLFNKLEVDNWEEVRS